jgi:hypothetical protein
VIRALDDAGAADPPWTPAAGVAAAEAALGPASVVEWCCDLLTRRLAPYDPGGWPLEWIGGPPGTFPLERWRRPDQAYWPRVWAIRALRYDWDSSAESAVRLALRDESWRVREHACAVAALREVPDAAEELAALTGDSVSRVRRAACKALAALGDAEHADALRTAMDDGEPAVRDAAERALHELSRRLDRPI